MATPTPTPTPGPSPTPTRAQQRAASTSGSAVAQAGVTTSGDSITVTASDGTTTTYTQSKGPFLSNDPPPMYKPYLTPGNPSRVGYNMSRGYIAPIRRTTFAGDPNPYFFKFHYNPKTIDVSTNSQDSANVANQSVNDDFINMLAHSGNYHFEFILDRSMEVAAGATSQNSGPTGTKRFAEFGTMYDIEYLYRTFNGPPGQKMRAWAISNYSSNYGFMIPTPCKIWLNNTMQWTGFPSSLSIQHLMYSRGMVPLITTVSLDFIGTIKDFGLSATLGNPGHSFVNGGAGGHLLQ